MATRRTLGRGTRPPQSEPLWSVLPLSDARHYPNLELEANEKLRATNYAEGTAREEHLAGRILLKHVAARLLEFAGIPGAEDHHVSISRYCPGCAASDHGIPSLHIPDRQPIPVSYSRCAGHLLVALHPVAGLLGADLADHSRRVFHEHPRESDFANYAFSPAERRGLGRLTRQKRAIRGAQWWALKEAIAKATGEGLAGEDGIAVVAGRRRHRLLKDAQTKTLWCMPGHTDSLGNLMPSGLLGAVLWSQQPALENAVRSNTNPPA